MDASYHDSADPFSFEYQSKVCGRVRDLKRIPMCRQLDHKYCYTGQFFTFTSVSLSCLTWVHITISSYRKGDCHDGFS